MGVEITERQRIKLARGAEPIFDAETAEQLGAKAGARANLWAVVNFVVDEVTGLAVEPVSVGVASSDERASKACPRCGGDLGTLVYANAERDWCSTGCGWVASGDEPEGDDAAEALRRAVLSVTSFVPDASAVIAALKSDGWSVSRSPVPVGDAEPVAWRIKEWRTDDEWYVSDRREDRDEAVRLGWSVVPLGPVSSQDAGDLVDLVLPAEGARHTEQVELVAQAIRIGSRAAAGDVAESVLATLRAAAGKAGSDDA